jgi:hypothetical protein
MIKRHESEDDPGAELERLLQTAACDVDVVFDAFENPGDLSAQVLAVAVERPATDPWFGRRLRQRARERGISPPLG